MTPAAKSYFKKCPKVRVKSPFNPREFSNFESLIPNSDHFHNFCKVFNLPLQIRVILLVIFFVFADFTENSRKLCLHF